MDGSLGRMILVRGLNKKRRIYILLGNLFYGFQVIMGLLGVCEFFGICREDAVFVMLVK